MKRIVTAVAASLLLTGISVAAVAAPADAHILPTTTAALAVHDSEIAATLTIPVSDLELATGLDAEADQAAVAAYIEEHISATSDDQAWATNVHGLTLGQTQQYGTATFDELTATVTLTPTTGTVPREFDLDYDVVLDRVATHTVIVSLQSDWQGGQVESTREIGTISENTATGDVDPLHVDLGDGGVWLGFAGLVTLGMQHILEGTDHQLFLLTLLLPAPLLIASRRWGKAASPKQAVRRIAA
ncbi:MAG: hypothetical protein JWM51_1200, partial [Microbacteriaceae bacterium]|nr:hypothetical protein [Microbacteriaceae bacterium]